MSKRVTVELRASVAEYALTLDRVMDSLERMAEILAAHSIGKFLQQSSEQENE